MEPDTRPNQVPVYFLLLDQQIWYITKFVSFYTPVYLVICAVPVMSLMCGSCANHCWDDGRCLGDNYSSLS
jgi:hypothetical protein